MMITVNKSGAKVNNILAAGGLHMFGNGTIFWGSSSMREGWVRDTSLLSGRGGPRVNCVLVLCAVGVPVYSVYCGLGV